MSGLDQLPDWGRALATVVMAVGAGAVWLIGRYNDKVKRIAEPTLPPATILGASIITSQQIQDIVVQLGRNETGLVHVEKAILRGNELLEQILDATKAN